MSRKIVFIGYSLSDADVHIKALFKKHLNQDTELVVVNPRRSADFRLNYHALFKKHLNQDTALVVVNPRRSADFRLNYHALSDNVRFVQRSFENLVKDEGSMRRLLSGK